MVSQPQRVVWMGVSVVAGLLLAALLHSGLALAAGGPAAPAGHPAAAGISLSKRVGTNATTCALNSSAEVAVGITVTYCFRVQNTGTVTLTRHTLVDDRLGTILLNFPYTLTPGATAFITQSILVTQSLVSGAVWTATNPSLHAVTSSAAQATITALPLSIALSHTVGLNSGVCAPTGRLTLPLGGGVVYYCYRITNTGPITMTHHDLVDSQLGSLLTNFPFSLVPGASAYLTHSATITQTTHSVATWTAVSTYTVFGAASEAAAVVSIFRDLFLPLVHR